MCFVQCSGRPLLAELASEEITRREATLAFVWAKMRVADEVAQPADFAGLTLTDFYEAIGRLADMMSIPTRDELGLASAERLTEFFEVVNTTEDDELRRRLLQKRPSSLGLLEPKTQPLAHKVELVCEYALAHLAIHFKGKLPPGHGFLAFDLNKCLTADQREKYLLNGQSSAPLTQRGVGKTSGPASPANSRPGTPADSRPGSPPG